MRYFITIFSIITGLSSIAQTAPDLLIKTDQTSLSVIIDEVGESEISYFLARDTRKQVLHKIPRSKVWKIIYANNDIEIITEVSVATPPMAKLPEKTTRNAEVKDPVPATSAASSSPASNSNNVSKSASVNLRPGGYHHFSKKRERFYLAGCITREADRKYHTNGGVKVGFEKYFSSKKSDQQKKQKNLGFGLSLNNFFEFASETDNRFPDENYYGSKHFLSTYLFQELDIKHVATLGVSLGPYMSVSRVVSSESNTINPNQSAIGIGAGFGFGEYIQKYIIWDRHGERKIFARLGWDQYVSANMKLNSTFYVSLGF